MGLLPYYKKRHTTLFYPHKNQNKPVWYVPFRLVAVF